MPSGPLCIPSRLALPPLPPARALRRAAGAISSRPPTPAQVTVHSRLARKTRAARSAHRPVDDRVAVGGDSSWVGSSVEEQPRGANVAACPEAVLTAAPTPRLHPCDREVERRGALPSVIVDVEQRQQRFTARVVAMPRREVQGSGASAIAVRAWPPSRLQQPQEEHAVAVLCSVSSDGRSRSSRGERWRCSRAGGDQGRRHCNSRRGEADHGDDRDSRGK